jgi:hemerythrin
VVVPPEREPRRPARVGLPWQLVGVAAPLVLAALLGLAWYGSHLAEQATARAAAAHLIAVRTAAEAGAAAELARLEDALRRLAVDVRTAAALRALADATRASEDDPRADASQLSALRTALLAQRERHFAPLLAERSGLDVATLLPTARRALWLQAQFLPGAAPPADSAYAAAHAAWHPVFAEQAARAGFADLSLVRASDGLVVYDVAKTPLFQTSLLDGPFADSHLGALARRLRTAPEPGVVRLVDFAPFAADGGAPRAAIAAPVLVDGRPDGILIATIDGATLTRALSVGGRWSGLGLGARGDVVLVAADGTLRSEPRQAIEGGRSAIARRSLPPSLQQAHLNADALRAFSDDDQIPMLAAVGQAGFGELGWRAVATIEARAARQDAGWVTTRLLLAALCLAALISAALAGLAWWLAVPLRHLGTALARFRPADPTAHVPALGRGDAAALATQVNHVLAQMRNDAANARRGREAETVALVRVVEAWRGGDRAPRAYASGELSGLATALNGLADKLAAPATPMVPVAAAEALSAAAEHLRSEAARHLDAVGAAAAAARIARERAAHVAELAHEIGDGSRQASEAAQAGQRAIAQLAGALAGARLAEAATSLDLLAAGSEVTAALADQLAVLAVNAALVAARDGGDAGDNGALAAEARGATEQVSELGLQLAVLRARLEGVPAAQGCAAAAGDARREVDRAADALARCSAEVGALVAALHEESDSACAEAVQRAHNAARRLCQAADLLAREATALGTGAAAAAVA